MVIDSRSESSPSVGPPPVPTALAAAAFAAAYFAAEWLGLVFYFEPDRLAAFWPASGLFVAAFVLCPPRQWAALLAAALAAVAFRHATGVGPPATAPLLVAALNPASAALEGALAAVLLRRWLGPVFDPSRLRHVIALVAVALAATAAGAGFGGLAARWFWSGPGGVPGLQNWQLWWFGDAAGVLVVAPALLSVALRGLKRSRDGWSAGEAALLFAGALAVTVLVFAARVGPPDSVLGFPYLIVPFLLWAALRFDVRVVCLLSLATALVAIGYTDAGRGPFIVAEQTTAEHVLSLQAFLLVNSLMPLIVHALAAGQRRSRDALSESELRYRTLVETTPDWVWEVDRDLRFTYASPRVRDILGYTPEEMIGRSVRDTLATAGAERVEAELATRAGAPQRIVARELVQRHRDGREVITETSAVPILAADGEVVGYRGVDRDVTERKRAEAEAARQREELLEADRLISLGTLVSGVAHEINNPNHFIALNLPVLRQAWDDARPILDRHVAEDPDFRLANIPYAEMRGEIPDLLDDLIGGSDRIKTIVSELRNYSRREDSDAAGRVDVNEVVRASLTLLANPIEKATRHFTVDYSQGLPEARGDLRRLEQVVINLILNACQALQDRDRAVAVRTRHDAGRSCLVIEVSDEGVGIEPEALAHIRDPFYTTKRDRGGTGLGLAVASRIVEEHGGRLEYDSRVGVGTTVRLAVPEFSEERE